MALGAPASLAEVRTKWGGRTDFWLLRSSDPYLCKAAVTNRYESARFLNSSSRFFLKVSVVQPRALSSSLAAPRTRPGFLCHGVDADKPLCSPAACSTHVRKGSVGLLVKHLGICKGKHFIFCEDKYYKQSSISFFRQKGTVLAGGAKQYSSHIPRCKYQGHLIKHTPFHL